MNPADIKFILNKIHHEVEKIQNTKEKGVITQLLNLVESLASQNEQFIEENQHLKDEINRLKGEPGNPKFNVPKSKESDISSLKELIIEMKNEVLSNAGVDIFEEVFKLIFTKLYDEIESGHHEKRQLEFRNDGHTESELKTKIQKLFEKACNRWEGVFADNSKVISRGARS
jgi:regulator of replication initiation timing